MQNLIHGGDLVTCKEKFPQTDFIDFSANINPLGMPEGVQKALADSNAFCTSYPDPICRELRSAIGDFEQLAPEYILCGNGAADLIYRIALALRPKSALLLAPTFAEYERALQQTGTELSFCQLQPEDGFAVGKNFLQQLPGHDIIMLCNPNNPTGRLIELPLLEEILKACNMSGSVLVVDECFLEFLESAESCSMKHRLQEHGNLLVLRAFTKIFAMPGLRLGYLLCGNREMLARIECSGAPWSVSVPAQLCGIAAVKEQEYLSKSRALVSEERLYLEEQLTALGFRVFQGTANYILFHSHEIQLAEKLCKMGIVLRDCSNYRGLPPGYFRTAVRTRHENNALLQAVKELL